MSRLFLLSVILLLTAICQVHAKPAFAPEIIDQAAAEPLLDFNVKWAGWRGDRVKRSKALNLLALAAFHNPQAKTSDGKVLADRVVEQIRSVLQPGNEPDCSGGLMGRSHVSVAHAFLLAQKTPAVWDQLSETEKTKVDWLMRAMTIAAHWCFDDDNNFKTTLDFEGNFLKTWNPNFVEPYMGVLIAATLFFGGQEKLNAIFTGFDYDTYIRQFDPEHLNFPNVTKVWTKAGKERMENGATNDGYEGSGKGVKSSFTYQGIPAGEVYKLYENMAQRQYSKTVTNGLTRAGATAGLISGSSPYLGQKGMMLEFESWDAKGMRSDANYCYHGWLASVPTRSLLQALGYWPDKSEIEPLMLVGSGDFIYKLQQGYRSHSKGKYNDHTEATLASEGYFYVKAMWTAL